MTTAALKKKIKTLVDLTSNEGKLNRVLGVLSMETKEEAVRRIAQEVVDASERSLKAGKGMDLDEFDSRSSKRVKRILAGRPRKRVAAARRPTARRS